MTSFVFPFSIGCDEEFPPRAIVGFYAHTLAPAAAPNKYALT